MWPFRCGFFKQFLPRTWVKLLREFFCSHINPNRMASLMGIRAVDKAHRNAGKIKVVRSFSSNQAEIFIRKLASFTFEIEELFRFFSLFKILSPNIIRRNRFVLFNSTVNILSDSLLTAPRSGRNPSDSEQIYAFNLLFPAPIPFFIACKRGMRTLESFSVYNCEWITFSYFILMWS